MIAPSQNLKIDTICVDTTFVNLCGRAVIDLERTEAKCKEYKALNQKYYDMYLQSNAISEKRKKILLYALPCSFVAGTLLGIILK